jgi:hypothetical protein
MGLKISDRLLEFLLMFFLIGIMVVDLIKPEAI